MKLIVLVGIQKKKWNENKPIMEWKSVEENECEPKLVEAIGNVMTVLVLNGLNSCKTLTVRSLFIIELF